MCPANVSSTVRQTEATASHTTNRRRQWAPAWLLMAAVVGGTGGSAFAQSTWVKRPVPDARANQALAYDSARGKVVLFGGNGDSGPLADTWEYDGTNWVQRAPATSPSAREGHVLAYDSVRGKVVLFGGYAFNLGALFEGTWEYGPVYPTGITAFGRSSPGCTGPLAMSANSVPNIGNAGFALTCGNAPPNSVGFVPLSLLGLTAPLPVLGFDFWLDPATLLVLPALISNGVGAGSLPLPVPLNPSLVGGSFCAQFLWVGPTAPLPCPPQGVSASNALRITFQP